MSIWNGDASDFYALSNDLSKVGAKAVPTIRNVMDSAGKAVADEWADNARANVREGHAAAYPDSIDHNALLGASTIGVEIGPNNASKQGFLGRILEEGGSHNAPQMNGVRAIETAAPRVERMIDSALGHLFG